MNQIDALYLDETTCNNRLNALLRHFSVSIQQFHSQELSHPVTREPSGGQIYLIQEGSMNANSANNDSIHINEPGMLLYPRAVKHRFVPACSKITVLSADLYFEGGDYNPINQALPEQLYVPFRQVDDIDTILALIFSEAQNFYCGRQQIVDGLLQVLFIQILRYLMETDIVNSGMLAGLAHPKLRQALIYIHEFPSHDFSIEELAKLSCMSRSMFAQTFLKVVGCTPGSYLQVWRINLVKKGLVQGRPLKFLVEEVGYKSEVSLSRAFKQVCGLSPRSWLQAQAS